FQFKFEAGFEVLGQVTRCTAPADHRVFLVGLVQFAANQVGVFVRLEIGQPQNDRLGVECRRNSRDAFGEAVDIEAYRAVVAADVGVDGGFKIVGLLVVFEQ